MSRKQYPAIGSSSKRAAWVALPDKAALKCSACGARAIFSVEVETSYMRGDDVKRKACEAHKTDAAALLRGEPIMENE